MIRRATPGEQRGNRTPSYLRKLSPDQSSFRPDSRNPLSQFILARRLSFTTEKFVHVYKKNRQLRHILRIATAYEPIVRVTSFHIFTLGALYRGCFPLMHTPVLFFGTLTERICFIGILWCTHAETDARLFALLVASCYTREHTTDATKWIL